MRVKKEHKAFRRRTVKHKNPQVLKKFALALAIVLIAAITYLHFLQPHTLEAKQTIKLQNTVHQLQQLKKQQDQLKTQSSQDELKKEQTIQRLNQQLQDAQKQLQARAAAKAQAAALAAEVPSGYTVTSGCGDNQYANYIYTHESGCRTNAFGSLTELGRACGIGQALPCSKMPCSLDDYACENTFFTNYAINTYGSWYNAYIHWINNHNW